MKMFLILVLITAATATWADEATVIFNCEKQMFSGDDVYGHPADIYEKFEVVSYSKKHNTIYGLDAEGNKTLLSEPIPADMRAEDPMRGFFPIKLSHRNNLLELNLYNDADRPECNMLLVKLSNSRYSGAIRIYWDNDQKYGVHCLKVSR